MQQVFVFSEKEEVAHFDKIDGLPVSNYLWPYLLTHFPQNLKDSRVFKFSVAASHALLKEFYSKYELSQPQRRIRLRVENYLSKLSPEQTVQLIVVEVPEQRSRKNSKKTESLY